MTARARWLISVHNLPSGLYRATVSRQSRPHDRYAYGQADDASADCAIASALALGAADLAAILADPPPTPRLKWVSPSPGLGLLALLGLSAPAPAPLPGSPVRRV